VDGRARPRGLDFVVLTELPPLLRVGGRGARNDADAARASIVEEAPELPAPAWVLEFAQRLGFDLADALAGHRELLADLFERVVRVHADSEAHAQDPLLARGQGRQNPGRR